MSFLISGEVDTYWDNTYYELKTRRVKHDTYPDTMCGANKLNFAEQNPENKYMTGSGINVTGGIHLDG